MNQAPANTTDDHPLQPLASEGLSEMLNDPDVSRLIVGYLVENRVPKLIALLIQRTLHAAAGGVEGYLTKALAAKTEQWLAEFPAVDALIPKLNQACRTLAEPHENKALLLEQLHADGVIVSDAFTLDANAPLEAMIALGGDSGGEEADHALRESEEGLSRRLDALRQEMFAPRLDWRQAMSRKASGFDRLACNAGEDEFVGREAETDALRKFAGDPAMLGRDNNFRWWLITGDGGEGKTRLALEFCAELRRGGYWAAGIWLLDKFDNADTWRPQRPVFLVIDHAQRDPERTATILAALTRNAHCYDFPVRLLLLERKADRFWTRRLLPAGADHDAILARYFEHEPPGFVDHDLEQADFADYPLPPLSQASLLTLMLNRFARARVLPLADAVLYDTLLRVDNRVINETPQPRVLFALAVAQTLCDPGKYARVEQIERIAADLTRQNVLDGIIRREMDQHWRPLSSDKGELRRYQVLLALATLCQGLDLNDYMQRYEQLPQALQRWLPPMDADQNLELLDAMGRRDDHLPPVEPDLLGEFFILETLRGDDLGLYKPVARALLQAAEEISPLDAVAFQLRLVMDFVNQENARATLDLLWRTESKLVASTLAMATVSATASKPGKQDWSGIDWLFARLNSRRREAPNDADIAIDETQAAVNVTNHAGAANDWPRVNLMLERIDFFRQRFPDNPDIALAAARAAFNVACHVGAANDWPRVDLMLERIDVLRQRFADNPDIATVTARAAVNVAGHAGAANDKHRVDLMLERIDALRQRFADNPDIATLAARAAVNVAGHAGAANDKHRVDLMLERIDALRQRFLDNPDIAILEARAAVSVIGHAGAANDRPPASSSINLMLERIDVLRQRFPDNPDIAIAQAKAFVSVTGHAGAANDRPRVDLMLERIDVLRKRFPDNPDIAIAQARAAVIVTDLAGAANDWPCADLMLERIDVLRQRFADNPDIAALKARATANVTDHAAAAHDWPRVDLMLERIDVLRQHFPDNPDIAALEARAAVNVADHAVTANDRLRVDLMLERIDALRKDSHDNPDIAIREAKAAFNVAYLAYAANDKLKVESMLGRINSIHEQFGDGEFDATPAAQQAAKPSQLIADIKAKFGAR